MYRRFRTLPFSNLKTPCFVDFYRTTLLGLLLFLGLITLSSVGHASIWQSQAVDSDEVKVWTKAIDNSDFKAFKGQVTINATVETVLAVVTDHNNYPHWYHKNKLTKKLKQISETQALSYAITQTPWPVNNRDSVTISTQTHLADGSVKIDIEAVDDAYPEQAGLIRITQLNGFWKLEKITAQQTRVTLQISAEPGGEIPSWLANSMVIDMPFYTLSNLKQRIEAP